MTARPVPPTEASMLLGDLTWPDFESRAHSGYTIVPVGALEPHGPHLPLASDTMISEHFAARLAHGLGGVVTPSIAYGIATEPYRLGGTFPGVISVSGTTFTNLVGDVLSSLADHGVRRIIVVNSAIDNTAFLCEAARTFTERVTDARVMIVAWWDVVGEDFRNALAAETGVARRDDHHAAMVESSLVMHIAPDSVRHEKAATSPGAGPPPRRMSYRVYPLPPDVATETGIVYTAEEAGAHLGARVADQVARQLEAAVRLEFNDPRGQ
ncbi:creatinine amidohydrolase [Streptomyces aurantiacus]|uniref:creatininase family protein n=1 Tax=Streptomyces aurantiacus TaxID=47760 RepID=UPI002794EE85|nr:creatininase family protein [Streptomyces aurantiacus]MDQ0773030.1 creatinine amidohydrolase [Streptomyces aurantiacus]